MSIKIEIGNKVKAWRQGLNLTQEEFAFRIEKSVDTVSAIERGKNFPSYETVEAMSKALNMPISEFYRFTDDVSNPKSRDINEIVAMLYTLNERDLQIIKGQVEVFMKR